MQGAPETSRQTGKLIFSNNPKANDKILGFCLSNFWIDLQQTPSLQNYQELEFNRDARDMSIPISSDC